MKGHNMFKPGDKIVYFDSEGIRRYGTIKEFFRESTTAFLVEFDNWGKKEDLCLINADRLSHLE